MRQLPNLITCVRIVLAFLFPFVQSNERIWVLAAALFTEFADGFIARRFHWTTDLGRLLDPIADKILFLCVVLTFILEYRLAWFEAVAIGIRDLVVAVGALVLLVRGKFAEFGHMKPTLAGKATTVFQYLVFFILAFGFELSPILTAIVFVVGALAGVQYVMPFIS